METLISKRNITYTLAKDGMYYPDFILPEQEPARYGKYGRMRKRYLEEHCKLQFTILLTSCTLIAHLNEVDKQANEQMELLIRQMAKAQGVDEALKARDQMGWVGAMNNIRSAAEEIVLNQVVYSR